VSYVIAVKRNNTLAIHDLNKYYKWSCLMLQMGLELIVFQCF